MPNKFSVALLPLDNRPVSYLLPKQIADFSGIDLILPERKYLGDLNKGSDLNYIESWLEGFKNIEYLVMSLDNWVYGGLVQSRKHNKTLDELRERIKLLKRISQPQKYAFSSIMRIANYNSNEEEKDYWKDYGENIFKWSELMYKVGRGVKEKEKTHEELIEKWYESSKAVPAAILSDYKSHRDKNLTVNLHWLELLHDKLFNYLIYSCDDSSKYGMNVVEAEYIKKEISKHNFSNIVKVISGTDEILLVLLTKANINKSKLKPSLSLYFNSKEGKNQIAKYESDTIYNSIMQHINILDLEIKDFNDSDIVLCVHLVDSVQGDHIFNEKPKESIKNIEKLIKLLEGINKPFIILDLAYANGADPKLIEALFNAKINWEKCYGYSAWNTCANSTGSALAIGINRWISEKKNLFKEEAFKKCLLIRFLDDYAYQTQIRHNNINEEELNEKIKPYVKRFLNLLNISDINIRCSLPWNRSFEVEIKL